MFCIQGYLCNSRDIIYKGVFVAVVHVVVGLTPTYKIRVYLISFSQTLECSASIDRAVFKKLELTINGQVKTTKTHVALFVNMTETSRKLQKVSVSVLPEVNIFISFHKAQPWILHFKQEWKEGTIRLKKNSDIYWIYFVFHSTYFMIVIVSILRSMKYILSNRK